MENKNKTTFTEEITVRDIFLAAFLILHEIKPTHMFKVGSVIYAAYPATEDNKRAVKLWESPSTMVPASRFAGAYHEAKRMFFENEDEKQWNKAERRTK